MNRHSRHRLIKEVEAYLAFCVIADLHPVVGFKKISPPRTTVVERIGEWTSEGR